MVTLMLLVPCYLFIANRAAIATVLHAPELPWDRAVPLQPIWALIYGALYMFLIVVPVLVVREEAHIRRTFWTYLAVWITAYVCFLVYPTWHRVHRRSSEMDLPFGGFDSCTMPTRRITVSHRCTWRTRSCRR